MHWPIGWFVPMNKTTSMPSWRATPRTRGSGTTSTASTVEEQLEVTRWLNERLKSLKYEIVSRHSFDDGYVQQYVMHGTLVNGGEAFRMPVCMNVTVRDGRIARLDEYLDSAHLKPLQTG